MLDPNLHKEMEIEMSSILQQFIVQNAHLFSDGVLAAAYRLIEEISKTEH